MATVYYTSPVPEQCQICTEPMPFVMYDAKVPGHGSWGNICGECFELHGCRLGTGYGQKYSKQSDGKWLKVEG